MPSMSPPERFVEFVGYKALTTFRAVRLSSSVCIGYTSSTFVEYATIPSLSLADRLEIISFAAFFAYPSFPLSLIDPLLSRTKTRFRGGLSETVISSPLILRFSTRSFLSP